MRLAEGDNGAGILSGCRFGDEGEELLSDTPDTPVPNLEDRSKAEIAYRLKLTRDVFGLDQKGFAGKAGIAANTFNQY